MERKYLILAVVSGLVVLAGIAAIVKSALEPVIPIADHYKGAEDPLITIVEYSDFQCPYCKDQYPLMAQVAQEYKNVVKVIYKHYPLNGHHNAKITAYATEAAGLQGKFWEMHDKIFDNQAVWMRMSTRQAEKEIISYAEDLGLDIEKFKDDIDSKSVKKKVSDDKAAGDKLGITGTPTLFFNGSKIEPSTSFDYYRRTIDTALGLDSAPTVDDTAEAVTEG